MGVGKPLYGKPARAERVEATRRAVALDGARARAKAAMDTHNRALDKALGIDEYAFATMRDGESHLRVELLPQARTVIEAEAHAADDLTETGGLLLGVEYPWGLFVLDATGPGPDSTREVDYVRLDAAHAQRVAKAHDLKCEVLGMWHTHRDTDYSVERGHHARLSETDIRSAARQLDGYGLATYASLVVTPWNGWKEPRIDAYVFTPNGAGPSTFQRAAIR